MLTVTCILLLLVFIGKHGSTAHAPVQCSVWGDPHVTRFPTNETDFPTEVWCKRTGLMWLVKNKFVLATIMVGPSPYFVLDFNFVWLDDNGLVLCTINGKNIIARSLPNCGDDIALTLVDGKATITHKKAEFVALITLNYWSTTAFSIWIWSDPCLAKLSDGICKTGCADNSNICTTHDPNPSQIPRPPDTKETPNKIKDFAAEICGIYIEKAIAKLNIQETGHSKRQSAEIRNARSACITDLTVTGNLQVADIGIFGLAIQKLVSNVSSTINIQKILSTDLIKAWNMSVTISAEAASTVNLTILSTNKTNPATTTTKTVVTTSANSAAPRSIDLCRNAKWLETSVTVTGGSCGVSNDKLAYPSGLFVDDDQTVHVADMHNHRIMVWKRGATSGEAISSGGHGPTDVIIEKKTGNYIICARSGRRVVRVFRQKVVRAEPIISDIDCFGLAMDDNRCLYVVDTNRSAVIRSCEGETQRTVVAGGNGVGDRLNQFNTPTYVSVDRNYAVYVSDTFNNRVMKWPKNAKEGIVIASSQQSTKGIPALVQPRGIIVDQLSRIYVASSNTLGVMRFSEGAAEGSIFVSKNGSLGQLSSLSSPHGIAFDRVGNLYVADLYNCRVQRYNINSTDCP